MSWILLIGVVLGLAIAFLATLSRRSELTRMARGLELRERTRDSADAVLQYPVVDLSRCLGCGTCVTACPESDVLELVHGQAMVVNAARCVGHATCERECPVGAITVTVANLDQREDVPVLNEENESVSAPGVYLAGELTAHALIKAAIDQGTRVARSIAARVFDRPRDPGLLDLVIVGAGPAGLACALEAKRLGLTYLVLEQETGIGGTVAKYPRRKLVLTRPVELPLHGPLGGGRTTFSKEELIELWEDVARQEELEIRTGVEYQGAEAAFEGLTVHTSRGDVAGRNVCLALGRRGTPRKLGIPGEELPKVSYSLLDAHGYQGRRLLVVGGGDSAAEAALALAEQPGNEVVLSYRREAFFRLKARNEERLHEAVREGRLMVVLSSEVRSIGPDAVDLEVRGPQGPMLHRLLNDEVFVMAGGVAPLELLQRSNVTCDPTLRAPTTPVVERGTGLLPALGAALLLAVVALSWALWHADYYLLPSEARPGDAKHLVLRPGSGLGLWFGIAATALIAVNFLYLARRAGWRLVSFGSLSGWMTSHVATGILALLFATLHGAMDPRDTVGGHALIGLGVLLVTGAVGRYFYAFVPRAANGRELELEEIRGELGDVSAAWDPHQRAFAQRLSAAVDEIVERTQWRKGFLGHVGTLLLGQRRLRATLRALAAEGQEAGIAPERVSAALEVARKAHRTATAAAHFEELRAILATWRYLHRWVAALMVLLLIFHVLFALNYASILPRSGP